MINVIIMYLERVIFKNYFYNTNTKKFAMIDIMSVYYSINWFWIWFNVAVILPFLIAFIFRIRKRQQKHQLWTDYLSRAGLLCTLIFYMIDTTVKVKVDGCQSICQKSLIIHHVASLFIMGPLIYNSYVPWWVNPIGFIHGYIVYFDDHVEVQYFYGLMMFVFHYMLYQKPYKDIPGYWITRFAINYVWTFILIYKLGQCSNFLPIEPDNISVEEGLLI